MSFGFGVGDFIAAFELAGKVRQKWVDAPVEYASIKSGVNNVENVLRSLNDLSQTLEIGVRQQNDLKTASTNCIEVLRRAEDSVSKYSALQDPGKSISGRARRAWKRFKLDPEDLRHLQDELNRAVAHLNTVQNNIEIDMLQDAADGINDIQLNSKQQYKADVADWFAPSDFGGQQTDQLSKRHPGTGKWFLEDPQYLDWQQTPNATLFCPGIPGSGKTIIVASVVDDLRRTFRERKDVVVAYFYCNFRRNVEQSLNHILSVLVRQLFQELEDPPAQVVEVYQEHKPRGTRASTEELRKLFRVLVTIHTQVFLLVDALDECKNEKNARDGLLAELFHARDQLGGHINILCTSRPIPDIANQFTSCPQMDISAQKEDLEVYLDGRMPELCSCVKKSILLQDEIKSAIIDAVDGMFLLAQLHFESLQDKITVRMVRHALLQLPSGTRALDTAYEEAMERIHQQRPGFRNLATKTLTWIVFAREELTIEELQEAIAVEPGMNDIDREHDLVDESEVVSACAGLVTVDRESRVVRLVHYTTQEYFNRTSDRWLPRGEATMALSCIDYLRMQIFEPIKTSHDYQSIAEQYQCLSYIGRHWGYHFSTLERSKSYLKAILCDKRILRMTGIILDDFVGLLGGTNLHFCAYFNDVDAIQMLLKLGCDPNALDDYYNTPLLWAAHEGHIEAVKVLLSISDIDVNLGDRNPLDNAIIGGHYAIVKLFMKHPRININSGSTLYFAAIVGKLDAVELLLSHPDIDVNDREPLVQAVMCGHMDIIRMLLTRPDIDVNLGMPLRYVADRGKQEIAAMLLAHPSIDVNLGDPLAAAGMRGNRKILQMLVAHPDIDVKASRYKLGIKDLLPF